MPQRIQDLHLYKAISRLSLNSPESVHSGESANEFEEYLHVPRPIEEKLAEKMHAIEAAGGGIVLLVGSAGDGKSHLISRMKKRFDWDDSCYYNDATASSSPHLTAIQTLQKALVDFSDERLETTTKKLVLAINLGKLNAFIDDPVNKGTYGALVHAAYPIFDNDDSTPPLESSRIKVLVFSDEQVFEFYPEREDAYPVESAFLSSLLEKVVQRPSAGERPNPFYEEYERDMEAADNEKRRNPLLLNYRLLMLPEVRDCVVRTVIEAIIRSRLAITAREFLDFVYSVLVYPHPDYSEKKAFYDALLPNRMFCGGDNPILRAVAQLDPLRHNSKEHDQQLAELFTSDCIPNGYINVSALPKELTERTNAFYANGRVDCERTTKFLFRLHHLMSYHSESDVYTSYLRVLRGVFTQDCTVLADIYTQVRAAIPRYCGSYDEAEGLVPIMVQGGRYKLFAALEMEPLPAVGTFSEAQKNEFLLRFMLAWDANGQTVKLRMDYQLFTYIRELNAGRLSSSRETEKNMEFGAFIRKLAELCDSKKKVVVLSPDGVSMTLKESFGKLSLQKR